jgi:hypothetical protein
MKKTLLLLSLASLHSQAAILLDDQFDDGNPLTNSSLGITSFQSDGWAPTESGGALQWSATAGWNWGGSDWQSNNEFGNPGADMYRITWEIGPMAVTTVSDQAWGDIRMQLSLVSANLAQGSASSEIWPVTAGVISSDIIVKQGVNTFANLHTKDSSLPTSSNGTNQAATNHQLDIAQSHVIRMDLTATDLSYYVDGQLSYTTSLAAINFGFGPGEEFANGWYPAIRAGVANNGRGTMSVSRMTVELIPEPATASLAASALGLALMRRRRRPATGT